MTRWLIPALALLSCTLSAAQPVLRGTVIGHLDGTIVVELEDPNADGFSATLEDGRDLRPVVYRVVEDQRSLSSAWVPSTRWRRAEAGERPTLSYAVYSAPQDAVGQGITVSGLYYEVVWLSPPTWREGLVSPVRPSAFASEEFRRAIDRLESHPAHRWRARLARGELDRFRPAEFSAEQPLELLARSFTLRWIAALGRIHDVDPELAASIRSALISDVAFSASRLVPVWLGDSRAERELLDDLLDPDLTAARVAERARLWLSSRPSSVTWIVDAGGSEGLMTIGVANLRDAPLSTRIDLPARDSSLDRLLVQPRSVRGELVSAQRAPPDSEIRVRPPGIEVRAHFRAFDMESWRDGEPGLTEDDLAWRLERAPPDARGSTVWRLWFDRSSAEPFSIRVHSGTAATHRQTSITPDGRVLGEPASFRLVDADGDRWRGFLEIPENWIERDQILRLGIELERVDGSVVTWPRPVLPWQSARPRALFDLGAWDQMPKRELPDPLLSR